MNSIGKYLLSLQTNQCDHKNNLKNKERKKENKVH